MQIAHGAVFNLVWKEVCVCYDFINVKKILAVINATYAGFLFATA